MPRRFVFNLMAPSAWLAVLLAAGPGCDGPEEVAEVQSALTPPVEPPLQPAAGMNVFANPFGGDPVSVFIGEEPPGDVQSLIYQSRRTGRCVRIQIGTGSGMHNGILVNLSYFDDYAQIFGATTPPATIWCNSAFGVPYPISLRTLVQDGQPIYINAGTGRDKIAVGDSQGLVRVDGGEGDDLLMNANAQGDIRGNVGDDVLRSSVGGPQVRLAGGSGADCLSHSSAQSPGTFDCGAGDNDLATDAGPGCEYAARFCISPLDNLKPF
jgi:hypothetical protein